VRRDRKQRHHRLEEPKLSLCRVANRLGHFVCGELGEQLRQLATSGAERARYPLCALKGDVVAERLYERQVGKRKLGFATRPPQHGPAEPPGSLGELARQPRLADACLTAQRYKAALAAVSSEQRVLEDE
jgi:hypothetical protein